MIRAGADGSPLPAQFRGSRENGGHDHVTRYADSDGFRIDDAPQEHLALSGLVINPFNGEAPDDEFVRMQIAGDELHPGDADALVAMGFNRHWVDERNAAQMHLRRQETLDDMTAAKG
jgi:hypothetical protein